MRFRIAVLMLLFITLLPATPAPSQATEMAAAFMPSVHEFGAVGDGRTDDTRAIQRALDANRRDANGGSMHNDYFGRPKVLYFPPGIYRVSATLDWVGCCLTIRGAGSDRTIIRLSDAAPGFADPTAPKPIIRSPAGNMAFRQYVRDLTLDTGTNNPGAVGLDFIASNSGGILNVTVRSGDGAGVAGIALDRQWPGPLLLRQVQVEGFDTGIAVAHAEYGPTFERIVLRNQRRAGISNDGNTLAIRGLESENRVPAIVATRPWSSLILLDAHLRGGAPTGSAIISAGYVYLRNVVAADYAQALRVRDIAIPGLSHAEYLADPVVKRFDDAPERSLNLPIAESPEPPQLDDDAWAVVTASYYGDTQGIATAFAAGRPGIAFPFGGYLAYNERVVEVPPSVRYVNGFSSVINTDSRGTNGGGVRLIVNGVAADPPLIVEGFGYGLKIEHRGQRTVALRHGKYIYESVSGAGDLFLDDVEIGPLAIQAGQRVWARQLNNEYGGTKISNAGGDLWILGLKTERAGPVIVTSNGGRTELLGTLIYPSRPFTATEREQAAFSSQDASMSLIYSESVYCEGCGYALHIEETRAGVTQRLTAAEFGGRMPLYSGYRTPTAANRLPTVALEVAQTGSTARLIATPTDPDGTLVAVTFLRNGEIIGEDRTAPYCLDVALDPGEARFTARVEDNNGATGESQLITVEVAPALPDDAERLFLPLLRTAGVSGSTFSGCGTIASALTR